MEARAELGIHAQQPLRTPRPGLDCGEVVELRHRTGGRSEEAACDSSLEIELVAVQDVPLHPERVGVRTRLQLAAEPFEPGRVEQLVTVDPEHPGVRADVRLQLPMRRRGVSPTAPPRGGRAPLRARGGSPGVRSCDMWSRTWIRSHTAGDVAERTFDVHVLVAHEHAPNDLHGLALLGRPVEQGPHDPFPLSCEEPTRGVAFAGVLHVERDRVVAPGVRDEASWRGTSRYRRGR